ncbi:MAG: hypothetical protein EB060_06695 [Proteobacteria bacterium]|nr:hypothetical protein [Pseudomonadota bacterium]
MKTVAPTRIEQANLRAREAVVEQLTDWGFIQGTEVWQHLEANSLAALGAALSQLSRKGKDTSLRSLNVGGPLSMSFLTSALARDISHAFSLETGYAGLEKRFRQVILASPYETYHQMEQGIITCLIKRAARAALDSLRSTEHSVRPN